MTLSAVIMPNEQGMMERATLSSWVNRMPARGCYFFTKKDILDQFPDMGLEAIRSAIRRMNVAGRIFLTTAWQLGILRG